MFTLDSPYDQLFYSVGKPDLRRGGHLEARVVIVAFAEPEGLVGVLEEPARGRRDGNLTEVAKVLAQPAGRHEPDSIALLLALGTVGAVTGARNEPAALPTVVAKSANLWEGRVSQKQHGK